MGVELKFASKFSNSGLNLVISTCGHGILSGFVRVFHVPIILDLVCK